MLQNSVYIKFKNGRKIKSPFMIYADFESNLVPENNGSKIQMRFIPTDIKNMMLVVMVIN